MSFQRSHPIWLTAGHSPFEVAMATVQAKMLSGSYRCGYLTRHWSSSDGFCKQYPDCANKLDDVAHILQACPGLAEKRRDLKNFTYSSSSYLPEDIRNYVRFKCDPDSTDFCQFILDCSNNAIVVRFVQEMGPYFLIYLFDVARV